MENKFFTFLNPVLELIDNGSFFRKPFRWLYMVLAALNLLVPIAILVAAVDNRLFSAGGKFVVAFIIIFLIICGLSWFGFQIWWNRREKVNISSQNGDEFVAIPVFSHFLQTCGEWLGMYVGVGGFSLSLIAAIFLGSDSQMMGHALGMGSLFGGSILSCLLFPIYGFLIVVVARVLAELYRALASIANNTRK
ncbi:MAG TPA: hypothetical protein H9879_09395 [Candidatus Alistipes intestinipullorum]|nr:hypothetical protein [Candidatus Alistipes intestinipullorum]